MGLFDNIDSKRLSDLKRYANDFKLVEVTDQKGRVKKKAVYTGDWTVLQVDGALTRWKLWGAVALASALAVLYVWTLLLTHLASGQLLVMFPLLAGLFPTLYLLMGVTSLPFRGKPMRRDQYMHSFIRSFRSAVAIMACVAVGIVAALILRAVQGDWLFLPEDRRFYLSCAGVIWLAAGIVILLRSVDVTERENAAYPSQPL